MVSSRRIRQNPDLRNCGEFRAPYLGASTLQGFTLMYPFLSGDSLAAALEMVCYVFTVVGAIVSYVLTARC